MVRRKTKHPMHELWLREINLKFVTNTKNNEEAIDYEIRED